MNIENTPDLLNYLRDRGFIQGDKEIQFTPLTGGVSNRTVKVDFDGKSWVLKQALEKLRVKGDWFSPPERIYFEAEAIRWFDRYLPGTCPKLVFEDRDQFILAMEAVPRPFGNLKDMLMSSAPEQAYFEKAGQMLGRIHATGLNSDNIPQLFQDTQFFESLRIAPYYLECSKQLRLTKSFFKGLIDDTRNDRYTLTHGDYSPKNLLVKDGRLILLDHEVAHFGDGTFDLGFFIAHLFSKANHIEKHREAFLDGIRAFFDSYQMMSPELDRLREERAVRHSIGCILARVRGLSRLDYLNEQQREIQVSAGLGLIQAPPKNMTELVSRFSDILDEENGNN